MFLEKLVFKEELFGTKQKETVECMSFYIIIHVSGEEVVGHPLDPDTSIECGTGGTNLSCRPKLVLENQEPGSRLSASVEEPVSIDVKKKFNTTPQDVYTTRMTRILITKIPPIKVPSINLSSKYRSLLTSVAPNISAQESLKVTTHF